MDREFVHFTGTVPAAEHSYRVALQHISYLEDLLSHSVIHHKKLVTIIQLQMEYITSLSADNQRKTIDLVKLQDLVSQVLHENDILEGDACEEWLRKEQELEEGE